MHKNHRVKNSEHNYNKLYFERIAFWKIYIFKCQQNMQIKNKAILQEILLTNRKFDENCIEVYKHPRSFFSTLVCVI